MQKIAVVGAGRMGTTIASMLAHTGDYHVHVLDPHDQALAALPKHAAIVPVQLTPQMEGTDLAALLAGSFALLSAAPFHQMQRWAQAAVAVGAHYLDLTEDIQSTQAIAALSQQASTALIPQCGLAPGFVSIAAHHLCQAFDALDTVHLRVGALPRCADNSLGYQLSWSTEGVINEYCQPCEAIVDGQRQSLPALQGLERLRVLGQDYEAFNTSGGVGSLVQSLAGQVRELNYKTLRYPGHAERMRFLLDELRLRDQRALLRQILEQALPATEQDVVVILSASVASRVGVCCSAITPKRFTAPRCMGARSVRSRTAQLRVFARCWICLPRGSCRKAVWSAKKRLPCPCFWPIGLVRCTPRRLIAPTLQMLQTLPISVHSKLWRSRHAAANHSIFRICQHRCPYFANPGGGVATAGGRRPPLIHPQPH